MNVNSEREDFAFVGGDFFSLKSGHVFEGFHPFVKMTEKEEGLLIHLKYRLSSPVIQGMVVQN